MQILNLINQSTIRQRMLILNAITPVVIVIMVSIYTYHVIQLEDKLNTMELVDDLFKDIPQEIMSRGLDLPNGMNEIEMREFFFQTNLSHHICLFQAL